jgi:hypothetical protein
MDSFILSRARSPWGSFYYMMVEVFGIGGGILNATRLPEKRAPGKYDLLGNSHQVRQYSGICTLDLSPANSEPAPRVWAYLGERRPQGS